MRKVIYIEGAVGKLETIVMDCDKLNGIAVVLHPNPNQGGLNTNKVVQTIGKTLNKLGYYCFLPNLRGVGKSDGVFNIDAIDDVISTIQYAQKNLGYNLPLVLGGFSAGAYISTFVVHKIKVDKLILIGAAVMKYQDISPHVPDPDSTLLIHGYDDEIILLDDVIKWSELQNIPVVTIAGSSHFFHGKLNILEKVITRFMYVNV